VDHPQPDGADVFDHKTYYPTAVTSDDDAGLVDGMQWCVERLGDGDSLTLWVPLKSSLSHNRLIGDLSRKPWVRTITGRGMSFVHGGPVLAAWPRMADIGEIQPRGSRRCASCRGMTTRSDTGYGP
jgi:hypothetical protein